MEAALVSAIAETDKAFIFRGNFIWRLAMGIWGSITSDLSIRVSDYPAEINIYKAIIRACLGNRHWRTTNQSSISNLNKDFCHLDFWHSPVGGFLPAHICNSEKPGFS